MMMEVTGRAMAKFARITWGLGTYKLCFWVWLRGAVV